MRPLQAHCHLGLGKLYRQAGRPDEARAELSTAVAMLREMEMTYWLPEAEACRWQRGHRREWRSARRAPSVDAGRRRARRLPLAGARHRQPRDADRPPRHHRQRRAAGHHRRAPGADHLDPVDHHRLRPDDRQHAGGHRPPDRPDRPARDLELGPDRPGRWRCCSTAWRRSIEVLVACRILQAVGATMVYAAGPAIVTEAFPSNERGRALGIMTMGGQVGMAVGPLFGGWLVSTFGWPAIFWARAPIALILGLASFWVIRDLTPRPGARPLRLRRRGDARPGDGGAAVRDQPGGRARAGRAPLPLGLFAAGRSSCSPPSSGWRRGSQRRWSTSPSSATGCSPPSNLTNLLGNLTMFGVWLLVPYYLVQGLGLAPSSRACCSAASRPRPR